MAYKKTAHRRRRVRSSRRKNAKSRKVMRGGARVTCTGTIKYNGGNYDGEYTADTGCVTNARPHTKDEHVGDITWKNGASYRGQWKDGKKEGKGEMRRSDGIIFKGEWKNDEPTGKFTVTEPNGKVSTINAEEIDDYGSPSSPPSGS
jgi:hypothetical protein